MHVFQYLNHTKYEFGAKTFVQDTLHFANNSLILSDVVIRSIIIRHVRDKRSLEFTVVRSLMN